MFVSLRSWPFARVDDEEEEIDAGRTGNHRADEPFVARDINDRHSSSARNLERRVPESDRNAARSFLGQPVCIRSRQCFDEPGLAVVNMARGAHRNGPDAHDSRQA